MNDGFVEAQPGPAGRGRSHWPRQFVEVSETHPPSAIKLPVSRIRHLSIHTTGIYCLLTNHEQPHMHHLLFATVLFVGSTDHPSNAVTSATELRNILNTSASTATSTEIQIESGCGPAGCMVDQLQIQRDKGFFEHEGKPLRLIEHKPTVRWSP